MARQANVVFCEQVLAFIDDPKTLARASQVSTRWHELLNDDMTWKILCDKHAYRRMSEDTREYFECFSFTPSPKPYSVSPTLCSPQRSCDALPHTASTSSIPTLAATSTSIGTPSGLRTRRRRAKTTSYRSHFKQRYMV